MKDCAGVPPKVTEVAPVRFVPVITTIVPPFIGPLVGEIELMEGATKVKFCVEVADPRGVFTVILTGPGS